MKKTTIVDQTRTPDGRVLTLDEHDGAYTIRVDGSVLMPGLVYGPATMHRAARLSKDPC
jgi:hypothetical protein